MPARRRRSSLRVSSRKRHAAALGDSYEAVEKRGVALRFEIERVASFSPFLNRNPADHGAWAGHREIPDISIPLVKKIANPESMRRKVVHIVPERSHAHHDRPAIAMLDEVRGYRFTSHAVRRIAL